MATPRERNPELARIVELLEDLKRLSIMQLIVSGAQSTHIAEALGIDKSAISRMLPVREIQKAVAKRSGSGDGKEG
jgi:hypothetical protein